MIVKDSHSTSSTGTFNRNNAGIFESSFFWGEGQFVDIICYVLTSLVSL